MAVDPGQVNAIAVRTLQRQVADLQVERDALREEYRRAAADNRALERYVVDWQGNARVATARVVQLEDILRECRDKADHAEDELLSLCPYFTGDADRRAAAIAAVQSIVDIGNAAIGAMP